MWLGIMKKMLYFKFNFLLKIRDELIYLRITLFARD